MTTKFEPDEIVKAKNIKYVVKKVTIYKDHIVYDLAIMASGSDALEKGYPPDYTIGTITLRDEEMDVFFKFFK